MDEVVDNEYQLWPQDKLPLGTLPCSNNPEDLQSLNRSECYKGWTADTSLVPNFKSSKCHPYSSCDNQTCGDCNQLHTDGTYKHLTTDPWCVYTSHFPHEAFSNGTVFEMFMGTCLALMHGMSNLEIWVIAHRTKLDQWRTGADGNMPSF